MDQDTPPQKTLDEMQASLDRSIADAAAGRSVSAEHVHAWLRQAMAEFEADQHGAAIPR